MRLKSRILPYIFAIGMAIFSVWLQSATRIWVGARFLLIYPTVILAAGLFGVGPAVSVAVIALIGTLLVYPMDAMVGYQSLIYLANTLLIIWLYWRSSRAEQILSVREEEIRHIFDATSAGIACVDPNSLKIVRANDSFAKMMGYELPVLIGQSVMAITHPDDVDLTKSYFKSLLDRKILEFRGQKRYLRHDGSDLWAEVVVDLVDNRDRQPVCVSAVIQDITDRKKLEDELATKRDELSRAQAVAQVGSWTMDIRNRNLKWSDETYRIFGVPVGTPITMNNFFKHVHNEDRAYLERAWEDALINGIYDERHRIIVGDELKWVRKRAEIIKDKMGTPIGWIGTAQDVTESVQAEEAIKKAKADAEQANLAKDRFLAMVSHELRTPLTTMQLWAQMMSANQVAPDKIKFAVRAIERSARSQSQLIDDLLDVSKIISGKLTLKRTNAALNDIIEEAIDSVEALARARAVTIDSNLDSSVGLVSCDPFRIKQIVWNLLTNAIKFSSQKSKIQVTTERHDDVYNIRVIDHGKGINQSILPRIFDRFVQADSSSTREHGGLGLGLAIVHDLVKMHGGTVSAASAGEGQGATFTVCLPALARSERVGAAEKLATNKSQKDSRPDLKGRSILLVDDSADTREVVLVALESMGANVVTAECASEALKLFADKKPDVLVSDISMPGEDGYSLIRKIRSLYGFDTPAIALTAYASEVDTRQALDAGFQMHLPKPVDWIALGKAIDQMTRRHPPAQELPGA